MAKAVLNSKSDVDWLFFLILLTEPVTFDLKRHNHASAFLRAIVNLYVKESDSVSESYLRFHPYD